MTTAHSTSMCLKDRYREQALLLQCEAREIPRLVGHRSLQRHIPARLSQSFDLLTLMGQPQQCRLAPGFASRQVCQAAVIEPPAHSQTPTHIVKPDQWQQH